MSVASIFTSPFIILYSLAFLLLSSNVGHFNSSKMLETDDVWLLYVGLNQSIAYGLNFIFELFGVENLQII